MKKSKTSFDDFYSRLHGSRWAGLRESLCREAVSVELSEGLLKPYYLDAASAQAAEALEVKPTDRVLDLCAAPGGKSLILALNLGIEGSLTANDRSSDRRRRLKAVLETHLPEEIRDRITITGHDASKWGLHEKNMYDKILLDAPCSSERHILNSPHHLSMWSPHRTKHLHFQQYAMLASAVMAVKPGGTILYCTCTISDIENDGVVEKLLHRKKNTVKIKPFHVPEGESTTYGIRLWPDSANGKGPIYIARIVKNE